VRPAAAEGREGAQPARSHPLPPPSKTPSPHARVRFHAASSARDVAPEVKNAAIKKLFADPHFNVMDGLDTYIDDYSKPDPIPPEMLRSWQREVPQPLRVKKSAKTSPARPPKPPR
jgi:hypothetical protein